jgi:hypothetical protein
MAGGTISQPSRPRERGGARPRWSWPHYLALIALPILVLEAWTLIAWLAAGPHQITQFRHGHTLDWWGARGFEALMIAVSIFVVTRLIANVREEGRLLTFDVMFCICGATLIWASAGNNFFEPMFSISSNFVNLNDTCGHNPLVVNPDCGRFANPIVFLGLLETFGLLGCAMLLGVVVSRLRARWPGLSPAQLFGLVCLGGCVLVLGEPFVLVPLHLWTFPGTPLSISFGTGFRYPIFPEILVFGLWIGMIGALRIFKDDRGRSFVERGLDHHGPRTRRAISLLALYGIFQLVTWGPATMPMWVMGFHQRPWAKLPAQLQNGLCDAPAETTAGAGPGSPASGRLRHPLGGTRYGPCPGGPDFHMPVSLPGTSP